MDESNIPEVRKEAPALGVPGALEVQDQKQASRRWFTETRPTQQVPISVL